MSVHSSGEVGHRREGPVRGDVGQDLRHPRHRDPHPVADGLQAADPAGPGVAGTAATGPLAAMAPAIALLGLGLHMLHNTLQTNATQMTPAARGLAVSTFANVLFMGQAAGVWLAGQVIDGVGFTPVFVAGGVTLLAVGAAFAFMLERRPALT